MAGVLEALPTQLLASLLTGNKQTVLTGAGPSSAGEKSLYCIEIFLCRLLVHPRGIHGSHRESAGARNAS